MHMARKTVYTPCKNESGRFWLKFGGRTINFIMTNEKKDKQDANLDSAPLKGPFEKGLWVGFGSKKSKHEKVENEEDADKTSDMDDEGLDMK